jgi:subtilisin family serine protease
MSVHWWVRRARRRSLLPNPSRDRWLLLEGLEQRQLLTGEGDWYDTPSPKWFQAADMPLPESDLAASVASSRWIVRLDRDFTATLNDANQSWQVFYPATVLASGVVAPWEKFRVVAGLGLPGQILVEASVSKNQAAADLAKLVHVTSFDSEQTIGGSQIPNDPRFGEQIGANNSGQTPPGGILDADIDAPEAWNLQTGSRNVVVAVLDSGIDYFHPDLAANIWTNPGESGVLANNGIDDDQNGLTDDVHGYDFVNNDGDPLDDNGHGTHVAGTIGAVGNNGVGVTGVAWQASLMALKFLDQNNSGTASDAIKAFNYMTMMKTRLVNPVNIVVSNNSWGFGGGVNVGLRQAVQQAGDVGILTVAAAGNGNALGVGINNDETPFYPASFADDRVISVAASDENDLLAPFSNFGRTTVDIAAPGMGILSTEPGGKYGKRNGTSMAAPHVSGVAALVFAQHPDATPEEVRDAILQSADKVAPLGPRLVTGGRLNAYGALTGETFAPKATLLSAPDITSQSANLASTKITVRYHDDGQLDAGSFTPTNILVQRVGFSSPFGQVSVAATRVVPPPAGAHSAYEVDYKLTPAGGFTAADAGEYTISVQANQVVDDDSLAAAAQVLGKFKVTLSNPQRVFIVNTTDDTVDVNPGDGFAHDSQGKTSLRAAVMEANHRSGVVTIVLPDGTYRLKLPEPASPLDLVGRGGDLDILGNIEIRGTGIGTTIIDAQQKSRAFELIPANQHPAGTPTAAPSLILKSLAIKKGRDTSGGAILVRGDTNAGSSLTIDHGLLTLNTGTFRGGAIASMEGSNTVTITATTLDRNSTEEAFGSEFGGGAIFNAGRLSVTDSTISSNVSSGGLSDGGGGGVLHVGPGAFSLLNSTISSNTATQSSGGGLHLAGPTAIENATITLNAASQGDGGGIFTLATAETGSQAGTAVATGQGYTLIGAPKAASGGVAGAGAAFLFKNGEPVEEFDNPTPNRDDDFGTAVVIGSGLTVRIGDDYFNGVIFIGAPGDDTGATDAGAVYVYSEPGMGSFGNLVPRLVATILNPSPAAGDRFGTSLAVYNNQLFIGAPFDDTTATDAGSVYEFTETNEAISLTRTFANPTPAAGDQFGKAVSVDRSASGGTSQFKRIVIGAPFDDTGATDAGAAYVFEINHDSTIRSTSTLTNPAPAAGDQFGSSVAVLVGPNPIVVGAPGDDAGFTDSGTVYVFDGSPGAFALSKTISNHTPAAGDAFGNAVAISADSIFVGAYLADDKTIDGGAAYTFNRQTGGITAELIDNVPFGTPSERLPNDRLGQSIANGLVGFNSGFGQFPLSGGAITFVTTQSTQVVSQPATATRLQNSIVASNTSSAPEVSADVAGPTWDGRGNIVEVDPRIDTMDLHNVFPTEGPFSDRLGPYYGGSPSLIGVAPKLGPLQDNGGPTYTHDLLPDSPGIDVAFEGALVDQRGINRPELTTVGSAACGISFNYPCPYFDIGAVENVGSDIRGVKYFDRNSDGVRQLTEPGIPGQTIFLDINENGRLDPSEPSTQTAADDLTTSLVDESGQYELQNVPDGVYLVVDSPVPGMIDRTTPAILKGASDRPAFRIVAETGMNRPGTSGQFATFLPPVLGEGTVVFADPTSGGRLFSKNLGGPLTALIGAGSQASSGLTIHPLISYDFDGTIVGLVAGNGTPDQAFIVGLEGSALAVTGLTGALTDELSVGNGFVAFHTRLPGSDPVGIYFDTHDNIEISAVNAESPTTVTTVLASQTGGIIPSIVSGPVINLSRPRVDSHGTGLSVSFGMNIVREEGIHLFKQVAKYEAGETTGYDQGVFRQFIFPFWATLNLLDADAGNVLFSAEQSLTVQQPVTGIFLVRRGGNQDTLVPIADSETPVPRGGGNTSGHFADFLPRSELEVGVAALPASSARAAISNGTIVFSARDNSDESGIYLAQENGKAIIDKNAIYNGEFNGQPQATLSKILSTTDTLFGKGIRSLQLADGNMIDGNQIAFWAEYDDGSQGIYVVELESVPGHRVTVQSALPAAGYDFPMSVSPAEIHGIAFNDVNRDGLKDEDELALAERTIFIDVNGNGSPDADESSKITDDSGSYFFDNLDPLQSYTIATVPEPDFVQTTPLSNNGTWIVTPAPGQVVTGINFGFAESTASSGAGESSKLAGALLVSANGKGTLSPNAAGFSSLLANLIVYLDEFPNRQFDPGEPFTTPDEHGQYSFSGLSDFDAAVRVTLKPGVSQLSPRIANEFNETNYALGFKPEGAAAGDFDHRNGVDLAVTLSNSNEVWIIPNTGNGGLAVSQAKKLATGNYPGSVATADLNNDGWLDLVVSNAYSNDISIFVNQKSETIPFLASTPLRYPTQNTSPAQGVPQGIAFGFFNNDALLDIAVANTLGNESAVFLNDTSLPNTQDVKFHLVPTLPPVGKKPRGIVSGHFTGGPHLDLAVANLGNGTSATSTVSLLQGTGQGTFTPFRTFSVGTQPTAIAAGQLNDDSFIDLVTVNYGANTITVLWGKANGEFDREDLPAGVGPSSVVIVDIDSDLDNDIAVSNGKGAAAKSHVLILRNQGGGKFAAAEPAGSATFTADRAFSLVVAEFNGSPGDDLALVNPIQVSGAGNESGRVTVLANQIAVDGSHHVALATPRDVAGLDFEIAFPWHNVLKPQDVTDDTHIVAEDVITIINHINARKPDVVPANAQIGPFVDVNNDGFVAADDVIAVINYINSHPGQSEAEADSGAAVTDSAIDDQSINAATDTSRETTNADLISLLAADAATAAIKRRRASF